MFVGNTLTEADSNGWWTEFFLFHNSKRKDCVLDGRRKLNVPKLFRRHPISYAHSTYVLCSRDNQPLIKHTLSTKLVDYSLRFSIFHTRKKTILGHDKMILCLVAAHPSIFNTPCSGFVFYWISVQSFFCVIRKFLLAK